MVKTSLEQVSYAGWRKAVRLRRGDWELVAPLEIGPRILRLGPVDGPNLFYEDPAHLGKTGGDTWRIYGGHRLWTAPENEDSYAPDNQPVLLETPDAGGFELVGQPHARAGWRKTIRIRWQEDGLIAVEHRLANPGKKPLRAVPWSLTVFPRGVTAFVPQPPRSPHPSELPKGRSFPMEDYLPNRTVALWKFTDLGDARFRFGQGLWSLQQEPGKRPFKIGFRHTAGWIGCRSGGFFFAKWIPHDPAVSYPDRDSNAELFTNGDILELESLAPDQPLPPESTVIHREWWHVSRVDFPAGDASAVLAHFAALPRPGI